MQSNTTIDRLANQGVPWAVRLKAKGWGSLRSNQKALARQALGVAPVSVVPTLTPRLSNGNPSNQRRKRTQPGNLRTDAPVTSSEYFADVYNYVGSDVNVRSWVVNPRLTDIFPRLSVAAALYNKYRVTSLSVRYSSSCSWDVNGKVIVGFTNDSSDPLPTTKSEVHQLRKRMECAAMDSKILNIGGDNTTRWMRDTSADDPKLVDYGRIILCTYGFDGNAPAIVGELSVTYTIVLCNPAPTASLSQYWENGSSTGLDFVKYSHSVSTKTYQFTFLSGGKFALAVYSDKGTLGTPIVTGSAATVINGDTSADETCLFITVNMHTAGGTITWVPSTDQGELTRWLVSRI